MTKQASAPTSKELSNPPAEPIMWVVRAKHRVWYGVGPYKSAFEARNSVAVVEGVCPSILRCEPQVDVPAHEESGWDELYGEEEESE